MLNNLIELIRPDLRNYKPYSSARDEAKNGRIWLNANESPYALDLFYDIDINRYPDKQPETVVQKIAHLFAVNENQIVLSRGSDEAIDLLVRLFCRAGQDAIAICTPTYGMYAVAGRLQGAKIIAIPLLKKTGYQLDLPAILACKKDNLKIIFLCSPNNPTGNLLKVEDILYLCQQFSGKSIIVVDEAYIEFSGAESLSAYINQYSNLVILRTLSKAYGLAGARFGFLLANAELVSWILKIIAPYPIASPIAQIVADVLEANNLLKIKDNIQAIIAERERLIKELQAFSFVKGSYPSAANFILVEMHDPENVMRQCSQGGIILREMFDKVGLDNCIRISVGSPKENNELLNLLRQVNIYA